MRTGVIVLALWAAGLGAAGQFAKVSFAWPLIEAAYAGHSPAELGLIVSVVGLVGLVFGTTAGLIVARVGPRRAILWAMALGAAVSLAQAGLPAYPAMFALRVAEGVSHLAIVVVGPTVIAGIVTRRRMGLAMALWSTFFGLTYAVLALLAPPVIAAGGVPALFGGHAVWMAVCGVLLWRVLPGDPSQPVAPAARQGLIAAHRAIYADPWIAAPAIGFVCYTGCFVALLTLLPPQVPGLGGLVAAAMPLVAIAVSLTLGVWAVRHASAVQVVGSGYAVAAAGAVLLAAGLGQGVVMAAAGLLMGAGFGLVQGASFAAIAQLNPTAASRARASGAIAQLGNLGTVGGTPVLAVLLDRMGPVALPVFALPLCLLGIGLVAWQARRRAAAGQPA